MRNCVICVLLLTVSLFNVDLSAEKLNQSQKASYQANLKYHDILENPQNFVDKKIALKVYFTETKNNDIKIYKDLIPETFDVFNFDGFSENLPVFFPTKDEYLKNLISSITKNSLVTIYCDVSFKTNKDKEKKNSSVDKRYFLKIEDIEAEMSVGKNTEQSADDFIFIKPIRLDIQYMDMLNKKVKLYLHFSEIGQNINPIISKYSSMSQNDFFSLNTKEKISLPLISSRRDEKIVSVLENLNPGELIIVYAIVQRAENPAVKNEQPIYYLNVIKVEKESE